MSNTINLAGLSDEQIMMRESVLELLDRVLPRKKIKELDALGEFPHDAYQALAEAGWMGLNFPEEYGGMGGSHKDLAVLVEALGYHFGGISVGYLSSVINAGEHIRLHASEELRRKLIPEIIAGKTRLAVAITEPGSGSDAASIKTTAVRDGDDYVINGQKLYITCAHVADYIVVVTKTDPAAGRNGMTILLVDAKAPGLTIRPLDMLGRRTSHANEVFFDNVRTPASWIIGEENNAWKNLMRCLNVERLCIAAMSAGNCFQILDYALAYAKERIQFGQPISNFQVTQHKFADMRMLAETARLYVYRVAELLDAGHNANTETAMAKVVTAENNFQCADMGLQIMGGAGYTMEYDMQMYWRDCRIVRIGGGTSEIQRNIIAKQIGL